MTPEAQAREEIDRQLTACGWIAQPYREMNILAGRGVAVGEFPLKTGPADYLLYADGKVIRAIEARLEGQTLTGVETQSAKYTSGLPDLLPCHRRPLPRSRDPRFYRHWVAEHYPAVDVEGICAK